MRTARAQTLGEKTRVAATKINATELTGAAVGFG